MSDSILLSGLRLMAYCGVLPEEQVRPQPFVVDVSITVDLSAPGASDALVDTIDYGAVLDQIVRVAESERFDLLERFATRICEVCLMHEEALAVEVTLRKIRPPVSQDLESTGVCLRRTRS